MKSRVVKLPKIGDVIGEGEEIYIIEAMKMQHTIRNSNEYAIRITGIGEKRKDTIAEGASVDEQTCLIFYEKVEED